MKTNNQKLKSVLAILAGFLTVAVLSTVTDLILEGTGVFPSAEDQLKYGSSTGLLMTALFYRSIYTILGGFVTAKLAPQHKMKHVKILAGIGLVGGILGVIAGWQYGNHWYPIALAITAIPLVLIGGKVVKNNHE